MSFDGLMLAAGRGTRLGPRGTSKPMVDVSGIRLYEFAWGTLEALGARKIYVVAGANRDLVRHIRRNAEIDYEIVPAGETIPKSVANCTPFKNPVAMMFADEYVAPDGARKARWRFLRGWDGEPPDAVLGAVLLNHGRRAEMLRTYSVSTRQGFVTKLTEKPKIPRGHYMGTGFAISSPDLLNANAAFVETDDWVDIWNVAIRRGYGIVLHPIPSPYFNVNTKEDLEALRKWVSER